ncbi:LrgB family protein [Sporosarcina limicola]|uniref:Murein hydrolase (TIGR00659 family) n=1 Tax=Sporosarcina limicola TaxID=34101 RepID=A0A927RG83_9BACL|nr:LrgB family protein [Sporosarcina limicola]MBE1556277.1 putative murein hydrolase (TIGR00659 family) [Sporosarcina limicola]
MQLITLSILFIFLTIGMYAIMSFIYVRYYNALLVPILTTTTAIIIVLVLFNVPYETYMVGGKWIDALLGPAVVSLSIPLYKQRKLLKQYLYPILGGVLVGSMVGMISGVLFAKLIGFSKEIVLTILPKSITTPIAMEITSGLGGIPTLATVFVIIAGLTGVLFGQPLFKLFKIDTALGRGIGLGVASHAIGTSKAIEYGEQEASMSSVAMTLSALIGSFLGPLISWLFY